MNCCLIKMRCETELFIESYLQAVVFMTLSPLANIYNSSLVVGGPKRLWQVLHQLFLTFTLF